MLFYRCDKCKQECEGKSSRRFESTFVLNVDEPIGIEILPIFKGDEVHLCDGCLKDIIKVIFDFKDRIIESKPVDITPLIEKAVAETQARLDNKVEELNQTKSENKSLRQRLTKLQSLFDEEQKTTKNLKKQLDVMDSEFDVRLHQELVKKDNELSLQWARRFADR